MLTLPLVSCRTLDRWHRLQRRLLRIPWFVIIAANILVFATDKGLQVIVDGVCSVASEEIRFDDWGIDVVMTASQKGIGVPPGLSLLCASERAINVGSSLCSSVQLISDLECLNRCSKNERLQ